MTRVCCTQTVIGVFIGIFVALFVVSLVLDFKIIPDLIIDQVDKSVRLDNNTDQFDRFLQLPVPVDFKLFVFQITNKDDVLNKGAKPMLKEQGPYHYRQYRNKKIISTNDAEDTITFEQTEFFNFSAEESGKGLSDNDVVTVINPVKTSIFQIAEQQMGLLGGRVAEGCKEVIFPDSTYREFIIDIKVKDLFFYGFSFCQNVTRIDCTQLCNQAAEKKNVERQKDGSLKFSLFHYKEASPDGQYTVKRGRSDIKTLGHIVLWNHLKYTDTWGTNTTCSEVKGTDSTLYPPRVSKNESFYVFATDICRYVQIDYMHESSYKGIDGYYFGTNNRTLYPEEGETAEDSCYCSKQTRGLDGKNFCFLDGAIDMQSCTKVPVVFTFPHFLWADHYRNNVDGLEPNETIHHTFLLVEPNTGTPLQGSKKIQLNFVFRPIAGVGPSSNFTRALVPLMWLDEGINLSDDLVDLLNEMYFDKLKLATALEWVGPILTAALAVGMGGFFFYRRRRANQTV